MKLSKKALEQKIKAVNKIAKITKAMKIIARMRLQKLLPRLEPCHALITDLQFVLQQLQPLQLDTATLASPLPRLGIIFTSDLGLCGSYNTNLFQFVKTNRAVKWIVIGKKGINYFQFQRRPVWFASSQSALQTPTMFTNLLTKITALLAEKLHQIDFFYTHPVSVAVFEPRIFCLWPVTALPPNTSRSLSERTFEPDREVILTTQFPFFFRTAFETLFILAKLSEQAIRQKMMERATENAEEMVKQLQLQANQTRQEMITNQLLEISQD